MGKELTKSKYYADFIHDIIKKEYQTDALYSLAKECQNKAENIRREGEKYLKGQKDIGCGIEKLIKAKESELKNITKYKRNDGTYPTEYETKYSTKHHKEEIENKFFSLTRMLLIFFLSVIVMSFPLLAVEFQAYDKAHIYIVLFLIVVPFLVTLIANGIYVLIVPYKIEEYTYTEERKVNKFANYPMNEQICIDDLAYAKHRYEIYQKQYETALDVYKHYEERTAIMESHAKHLANQARRIKSDQKKMLEMNIIPPDYRDLKCLFELYRIFYNNLADTMREAIAIYEERVFRGLVVKGLYQLNNKFSLISEYIIDMKDELHRISRDTDFMSGEIQRIRENQDDQHNKQDEIIEEIRATRYANEAVKESQERCEWYMHYDFWFK